MALLGNTKINGKLIIGDMTNQLELVYPIGSIYMSTTSTNPSELFGFGTWENFSQGRVLIGVGSGYSAESTGGASTASVSISQIPSHRHTYVQPNPTSGGSWSTSWTVNSYNPNELTSNTGGTASHNNMQPYIVVNIWRRTA